jgi:hypothetical protein
MISLIIILIIVGALLYVLQYLPLDGTIKMIINVLVIVVIAIYVLRHLAALGLA